MLNSRMSCMAALAWPLINLPPGAQIEPATGEMRHNGYPLQVIRFTAPQDAMQVLAFFNDTWKASRPASAHLGDWKILSKQEGPFVTTVEMREESAGSTEGVVAVRHMAEVRNPAQDVPADVPITADLELASILHSEENEASITTLLLRARTTGRDLHEQYKAALAHHGWIVRQVGRTGGQLICLIEKKGRSGVVHFQESGSITQVLVHVEQDR